MFKYICALFFFIYSLVQVRVQYIICFIYAACKACKNNFGTEEKIEIILN